MDGTCLWDSVSKLHDKLERETTEWIERRKENEINADKNTDTMATAWINANRAVVFDLAIMLVKFEEERKCCSNCKWRYVKDYTFGICDNPKTTTGRTEPDGYCDFFERRK